MSQSVMPGRNGGTLRRGGSPGRPKGLSPEFFSFFENGDAKLGLPPRKERFLALLTCEDPQVRIRMEQLLLEHQHGKPVQAVDHSGEIRTGFALEVPAPLDSEAWLNAHIESQKQIAEADGAVN